jgi:hypothetical protein
MCEQAPALDAGRHCNALNHNAGSLQKVINIARRFTRRGSSSSRLAHCPIASFEFLDTTREGSLHEDRTEVLIH